VTKNKQKSKGLDRNSLLEAFLFAVPLVIVAGSFILFNWHFIWFATICLFYAISVPIYFEKTIERAETDYIYYLFALTSLIVYFFAQAISERDEQFDTLAAKYSIAIDWLDNQPHASAFFTANAAGFLKLMYDEAEMQLSILEFEKEQNCFNTEKHEKLQVCIEHAKKTQTVQTLIIELEELQRASTSFNKSISLEQFSHLDKEYGIWSIDLGRARDEFICLPVESCEPSALSEFFGFLSPFLMNLLPWQKSKNRIHDEAAGPSYFVPFAVMYETYGNWQLQHPGEKLAVRTVWYEEQGGDFVANWGGPEYNLVVNNGLKQSFEDTNKKWRRILDELDRQATRAADGKKISAFDKQVNNTWPFFLAIALSLKLGRQKIYVRKKHQNEEIVQEQETIQTNLPSSRLEKGEQD